MTAACAEPDCPRPATWSEDDQALRFWRRVEIGDGCWLWTGGHSGAYGSVYFNGVSTTAHRAAWCLWFGAIRRGQQVYRRCDNQQCVRPAHLYLDRSGARNRGKPAVTVLRAERHPQWRGGRIVDVDGYVKVLVPGHPRADSRGYVFEHLLVVERICGRPVDRTEEVHHRNHKRDDNRPENLELMTSHQHHAVRHRSGKRRLRDPGEPNPEIACACGCDSMLLRFDREGRSRDFVYGHQSPQRRV